MTRTATRRSSDPFLKMKAGTSAQSAPSAHHSLLFHSEERVTLRIILLSFLGKSGNCAQTVGKRLPGYTPPWYNGIYPPGDTLPPYSTLGTPCYTTAVYSMPGAAVVGVQERCPGL